MPSVVFKRIRLRCVSRSRQEFPVAGARAVLPPGGGCEQRAGRGEAETGRQGGAAGDVTPGTCRVDTASLISQRCSRNLAVAACEVTEVTPGDTNTQA